MAVSYTAGVPILQLTAEVVKNLSAASGVAYMKSGAILTLLAELSQLRAIFGIFAIIFAAKLFVSIAAL